MCGCMAGFRRLCGRFLWVAAPTAQNGAESAKFKRLRRFGALCRLFGRVGESGAQRAHAQE